MPEQPKFDDINVPAEMEKEIEKLPEVQKEPARQSLRFAVFLLTIALVIQIRAISVEILIGVGLFGFRLTIF